MTPRILAMGRMSGLARPAGWVAATGSGADPTVFWPFNPDVPPTEPPASTGPLQNGQYVRIVGTLWEDGNHGAQPCWDDGTTTDRGWKEIHPVDTMVRLSAPTNASPHPSTANGAFSASTYAHLAICHTFSLSNWQIMAPPRPTPTAVLRYEILNPDGFTTFDHSSLSVVIPASNDRVIVAATTTDWGLTGIHHGRLFALFRVFWDACTPLTREQACGARICGPVDLGCGLGTTCGTCAPGSACRIGQCCPTCPVLEVGDACGTAFSACGDCTDCPDNSTCSAGQCRCGSNFKPCGGTCIPKSNTCQ